MIFVFACPTNNFQIFVFESNSPVVHKLTNFLFSTKDFTELKIEKFWYDFSVLSGVREYFYVKLSSNGTHNHKNNSIRNDKEGRNYTLFDL